MIPSPLSPILANCLTPNPSHSLLSNEFSPCPVAVLLLAQLLCICIYGEVSGPKFMSRRQPRPTNWRNASMSVSRSASRSVLSRLDYLVHHPHLSSFERLCRQATGFYVAPASIAIYFSSLPCPALRVAPSCHAFYRLVLDVIAPWWIMCLPTMRRTCGGSGPPRPSTLCLLMG